MGSVDERLLIEGVFSTLWYGLLSLLIIVFLMVNVEARSKVIRMEKDTVQRINYGVIFQPDTPLVLSQEYWTHTFHLRLSDKMQPTTITRCRDNSSYCVTLNNLINVIHTLHIETKSHVGEVIKTIKSLIPTTHFATQSKSVRAFLPFIGSLSRSLFGTATLDDVNLLASHVNALNTRTSKLAKAMLHSEARLSCFISVVDKRTTNLFKGIQLNSATIMNITKAFNAKIITLERVLINVSSTLVQQINKASVIGSNLGKMQSAIQCLVEGKLSPFIISRSKLRSVIKDIAASLAKSHKGFYLSHVDPAFYYSHPSFIYARHYSNIYISLKFPISTHEHPLQLYYIITLPVPINDSSSLYA